MPDIDHRDCDGDPIYADPGAEPGWDLEGPVEEMEEKALCAAVARDMLGCKIKWWGYYCDWVCGCKGIPHACDSQCSALAMPNQMLNRVLDVCDKHGISLLAARPEKVLRSALTAWRNTKPEGTPPQ